jgi:hypothetical protein
MLYSELLVVAFNTLRTDVQQTCNKQRNKQIQTRSIKKSHFENQCLILQRILLDVKEGYVYEN